MLVQQELNVVSWSLQPHEGAAGQLEGQVLRAVAAVDAADAPSLWLSGLQARRLCSPGFRMQMLQSPQTETFYSVLVWAAQTVSLTAAGALRRWGGDGRGDGGAVAAARRAGKGAAASAALMPCFTCLTHCHPMPDLN